MPKKSKIILFEPLSGILSLNYKVIPLSLLAISRFIDKKKFDIIIIDQKMDDWIYKLKDHLYDKNLKAFGITSLTGYQLFFGFIVSKIVKKIRPDVKIVFGGAHATAKPRQLLEEPFVDFVIIGDGEENFPLLVNLITGEKLTSEYLKKIPGLGYKIHNKIFINSPKWIDYHNLDNPSYELVDVSQYNYVLENKDFYIEGGKGCIFNCTFCHNSSILYKKNCPKWRPRSAEKIVDNIKLVVKKYNIRRFFIIDDSFLANTNRLIQFLDLLEKEDLNITWSIEANLVHLYSLDESLIYRMYKLGLRWISVGVESGSDKIRRFFKKFIKNEHLLDFNKRISKYDIKIRYNFMVGAPIETLRDIRKSLDVVRELLKNKNALIQPFYITVPFPDTEYEKQISKYGYIGAKNTLEWCDYDPFSISFRLPWLKGTRKMIVEFLMYSSFFIDNKMEYYFSSNSFLHKFMRSFIKVYRPLVKFRFFNLLFWFFLEKYIFDLYFWFVKKRTIEKIKKNLKSV